MTREKAITELVAQDINDITQMLYQEDYEFITNVLTGNGFTGYNNLSSKELTDEYNDRLLPDDAEPVKVGT